MISRITRSVAAALALCLLPAGFPSPARAAAELKFTSGMMLAQPSVAEARIPMFERWMQESGGKLVIEFFNANTIVNAKELLPAVERGVIDITVLAPSLTPNVFPITSAYELPFLFHSTKEAVYAYTRLLRENPEAAAEYEQFKILAFTGSVPNDIVSLTPIRRLEDLRGKRVGVLHAQTLEIAKLLGMTPVLLTLPDFYLSLQRGVIDCTMAPVPTYRSTKVCEVGKYIIRLRVSMSSAPTVMNKKAYDSLPADVREIIDRYTPDAFNVMGTNVIEGSAVRDLQWLKDNNGVEVIELPAEDVAKLPGLVAPAYAAWEEMARKYGVKDPEAILAQLRSYAEEYRSAEAVRDFESRYLPLLGDMYKKF